MAPKLSKITQKRPKKKSTNFGDAKKKQKED
jgi:hypothetical protein